MHRSILGASRALTAAVLLLVLAIPAAPSVGAQAADSRFFSQTGFRVHWPARARVVLLDRDDWTPLAISPILVVGRRPPRR